MRNSLKPGIFELMSETIHPIAIAMMIMRTPLSLLIICGIVY
jgi:hypothetical protein